MTATLPSEPNTSAGGPSPERRTSDVGLLFVVIVAFLALVLSFVAFATDDGGSGDAVGTVAGSPASASEPVHLALSEFALSPNAVTIPQGGSLHVMNEGGQIHNVMIEGTDLVSPDLAGGESAEFDLSSLDPGEYTILCHIPGHKEAGMTGTLTVAAAGETVAAPAQDSGHGGHGADMTPEEAAAMDQAMMDSMAAFPAETEGVGNQVLEPVEVMEDGTKRFELSAEIVDWEVEPGKFVEAWTYNGMVPGPYIKVDLGDKLRFDVTNNLPLGTDVHWHGVRTPNTMDGVAPYSQELIKNGETFSYEFTAVKKAVGIYHAHAHGQMKVPNGMLGIIQIGDVDLPRGRTISGVEIPEDLEIAHEIPMVLNDAGNIGLSLNGKSFPATAPLVVDEGDWLLVHYANEGLQVHPMHQHQFSQLVVAKDGIPLDNPYFADTINVAPGERYSVLIHADEVGTWVWHCHILTHVEREDGMFGMATAIVVQ